MIQYYSEEETLRIVGRLDRPVLRRLVETRVLAPVQSDAGPRYTQVDIARIELLCDLTEGFDLDPDGLELMMTVIDQLHRTRADLHALARALDEEPDDVRSRVLARLPRTAG